MGLNRKNRRQLDVLLKKRQKSVIDSLDDHTLDLWKQAQANLQWLVGDPIQVDNGTKVDFSMFDFVIATTKFTYEDSYLKKMQSFWVTLYPYVENVVDNLNHYKEKFKEIYGIEGETLKKFALQNLELQCYQKFMKEELEKFEGCTAQVIQEEFDKYHKNFKDESDKEIAKIKAREDEFVAKQEAKLKEREEEEKRRSRMAKLSI